MRLYLLFLFNILFFLCCEFFIQLIIFLKKYLWQNAIRRFQSKVHLAFFQVALLRLFS